jgi:hypothetical protein
MHIAIPAQKTNNQVALCGRRITLYEISMFTAEEYASLPESTRAKLDLCAVCQEKALASAPTEMTHA